MFLRRLAFAASIIAIVAPTHADETWRFDTLPDVGGHAAKVLGAPKRTKTDVGEALAFDGKADGVFVPAIPIDGAQAFTIEVLFSPAGGGTEAARFIHVQDRAGRRGLLELRTDGRVWWLDTYLRSGESNTSQYLVLIDPTRVHPSDRWYWVALRYDGKHMANFVNGVKELEGEVEVSPFSEGSVSIGVRQNLVSWFKGAIAEVRFHREAVREEKLQRLK